MARRTPAPVAVIGMSVLFPDATDTRSFWRNILSGKDSMTDVPASHWLIDDYYDPNPAKPDKTYAKRGAFLPNIPFDPMAFGIPPNMVPSTDTSQLLALIVAKQVLHDAARGGDFAKLDPERISVILGATGAQELMLEMTARLQRPVWARAMRELGHDEQEIEAACGRIEQMYVPFVESTFPGLLGNVIAGRIANRFNLGGTNCVTDAACASSLSALSMGLQELELGHSDVVIAGGVDTMNDISMFMCFSKTPALSPTGDCRPFSDQADGTMLGEGLAMLALKRLDDAERDGDQIYAVIKALGSSSDGRALSVYAPLPEGQAKALRRTYEAAGYGPETVELVEAHGTGTKAGDAAEFTALAKVFDETNRKDRQWCALGSVKSQIGHTKGTAGAAGLAKVVLALQHKALPPTIKVEKPNPALKIEQTGLYLNTQARPWIRDSSHPRRASVSSFGFGGSNFHVTLEEYTGAGTKAPRTWSSPTELLLLSAATPAELIATARETAKSITDDERLTARARQTQQSFDPSKAVRASIVASDPADLRKKLEQLAARLEQKPTESYSSPTGIYVAQGAKDGSLAFLFPGQGSQYVNMGADLALTFDDARTAWDAAASIPLASDARLHDVVFPRPVFSDADREAQTKRLTATEWAQPAIGTASLAQLALLKKLGVAPERVGGHSYGELTALHCAGVFDLPTLLRTSRKRGELMRDASVKPGAMTAVGAPVEQVLSVLKAAGVDVGVANDNSPKQVVLSGTVEAIEQAEKALQAAKLAAKRLPVATAFHSPVVAAARDPFLAFLQAESLRAPTMPVLSNVTALAHASDAASISTQLADQIVSRVRFVEMVNAMYEAGVRTFVEVGPGNVLSNLVEQILGSRPAHIINLDRKGAHGLTSLWQGLGRLAVAGYKLNFAALYEPFAQEDARPAAAPKFAISINGANYGRPYPARNSQPLPPKKEAPRPIAAAPQPQPIAIAAPPPPPPPPAPVIVAPRVEVRSVEPLAAAHAAFQQALSDGHLNFLKAMETSFSALAAATTGTAIPASPQPVVISAPPPPPAPVITQVVAAAPAPVIAAPPPAPVAVAAPKPTQDPTALLIAIVADKTGYPIEMLNPGMSLEGDLGVDSIKRVEILSAIKEKLPELPTIKPADVASLRTLGEIANHLAGLMPAGAPAPVAAPKVAAVAGPSPEKLLIEVVADKTGYPVEMLNPGMSLEGDLGVDSIKRVEILSAIKEKLPELPTIKPADVASLRTLGEIAKHLSSLLPTVSAPVSAPAPVAKPTSTSASPEKLLIEVVADKTGYPVEMLNPGMSLEGDLGVDSIKRVEILSALKDRIPELPTIKPADVANLRTLGEIAKHLTGLMPAATPAPASVPSEDLTTVVLSVVAEKTGYPTEMLNVGMSLEGDLGIDSIKRVEILSAMKDRLPQLPALKPADMATLRTLGQIIDYLKGSPTPATPAPAPAKAVAPARKQGLARNAVVEVGAPASGVSIFAKHKIDRVLVTDEGTGVSAAVAARLRQAGIPAESTSTVPSDATAVIYLGGLAQIVGREDAFSVSKEAFQVAHTIASTVSQRGGAFITVQDTGGDFGLSGKAGEHAWFAGLAGLTKTAAQEWPNASVKAIDIARAGRSVGEIADALVAELLTGGSELEVGLHADGTRTTLVSMPSSVSSHPLPLKAGSVVVVSGGARGVTVGTLEALAKQAPIRIAILGRSQIGDEPSFVRGIADDAGLKRALLGDAKAKGMALTPADLARETEAIKASREARAGLESLRKAGADVRYLVVDVRDGAAVAESLADVRRTWGPIAGVIHAAGVLADKAIAEKTAEQFDRVFDTKVRGFASLLDATKEDPLSFLCVFSSVAARAGNPGQSDYALSNETIGRVAAAERVRRNGTCIVRSIGWGPWEGGMVTPGLKALFESRGVPLISLAAGAQALVDELRTGSTGHTETVIGGTLDGSSGLSTSALEREVIITPRSMPFLESHRVHGKVVLPAVVVMEWFKRTAKELFPKLALVSCEDLRVLKGVVLAGDEAKVLIRCTNIDAADDTVLSFELVGENGARHYSARVRLTDAARVQPAPEAPQASDAQHQADRAAKAYESALFHGPHFQALRAIGNSTGEGIEGTLTGARTLGWDEGTYTTDPALLDGGLQLALLWGHERLGQRTLPTRIGELRVFRPGFIDGPVRTILRAGAHDPLHTRSTVSWVDQSGRTIAVMDGVEMHVIADEPAPRDAA